MKKEVFYLTDDEESPKARLVKRSADVADNDDKTQYLSKKLRHSKNDKKGSKARLVTSPAADQDDEIHYLSEDVPFFDVILAKSHVDPANSMNLPVTVLSMLPRGMVFVVLIHGGKKWEVYYNTGDKSRPRFTSKWKTFAMDNCLKLGDACVFELIDPNRQKPVFKVHIIRGDVPPELQHLVDTRGSTAYAPIDLD